MRLLLSPRPYHLRLTGDVVVSLELLRALGPGTRTFSASRQPGPLYKLDLPGGSRNIPPAGTRFSSLPWRKNDGYSVGISAVVLPEPR